MLHLAAGVVGLVVFLGTGQFMHWRLDHLAGMADGPRALYRSGHIYILFSALLNLLLGLYLREASPSVSRTAQRLGSALVLVSLGLLFLGFVVETPSGAIERPAIRWGIIGSLAGVLLHAAATLRPGPRRPAGLPPAF